MSLPDKAIGMLSSCRNREHTGLNHGYQAPHLHIKEQQLCCYVANNVQLDIQNIQNRKIKLWDSITSQFSRSRVLVV